MLHRAHDYRHLIQRWRAVAKAAGVPMQRCARAGDYDIFQLRTPALAATGGMYISAGIHGDEPGATEGLIAWAEKNARRFAKLPLLIFPCLNPWGLVNNTRTDADGDDLNRLFHVDTHPLIHAVKQAAAPFQFSIALHLHEDFDGQGLYIYEVQRKMPYWGEDLLAAARGLMPTDQRARIDGRLARGGLIRRRIDPKRFARMGYPEAIWMHCFHAERTFTIETPSEFALDQRARAHVLILDECVRRCFPGSSR